MEEERDVRCDCWTAARSTHNKTVSGVLDQIDRDLIRREATFAVASVNVICGGLVGPK